MKESFISVKTPNIKNRKKCAKARKIRGEYNYLFLFINILWENAPYWKFILHAFRNLPVFHPNLPGKKMNSLQINFMIDLTIK